MINFKVIIPIYNSEMWVDKCLSSLKSQTYKNFQCIVIDDASTDGTHNRILEYYDNDRRFFVIKRDVNFGALANISFGVDVICNDENDVIVLLDGDDWLSDDGVLEYLSDVYSKTDLLLTYGSMKSVSGRHDGFCKQITSTQNYRLMPWVTSHLRTFKYKIWKNIKKEDLLSDSGKYYTMAWDMAIMYPLIEMSGLDRIKFIDRIMYVYNDQNPLNDFRKNVAEQLRMAKEIKNKKPYERLNI
jgi:glycosyltransferase involved in cell wall biosynthesis